MTKYSASASVSGNSYTNLTIDATADWPFLFYGAMSTSQWVVLCGAYVVDGGTINGFVHNVSSSTQNVVLYGYIKKL